MRRFLLLTILFFVGTAAYGQIQVELKFNRVPHIAYESVIAQVQITNLAGRDVELHDQDGQRWFGFELTAEGGRLIAPNEQEPEPPLKIEAGKTVLRKVNLTPRFPIQELGNYHARAHVYFGDLNKFFYSQARVFQVTDARPIWQRTVGVPEGNPSAGATRTYSLLSNRFPDHTSLYVRVEDKSTGAVYSTYSLGRLIAFDEPQAELDQSNRLHVLHCAAPRTWAYSQVNFNGELMTRSTFMETKSRPRLRREPDGAVAVRGGMRDAPMQSANPASKLSTRPASIPTDD